MAKSTIHKTWKNSLFAVRLKGRKLVSGRMWNNMFHLGDRLIVGKRTHGSRYEENAMDMMESYYASGKKCLFLLSMTSNLTFICLFCQL